jgi:hypothetical protein
MDDQSSGFWRIFSFILGMASVPGFVSGIFVFLRWIGSRRDRNKEIATAREMQLMVEMDARAATLSREHAEFLERLKGEILRLQARLRELEDKCNLVSRDRDRGWELARWWNARAHVLRHDALNAQQSATHLARERNLPEPTWPDMTLPDLEDPK